MPGSSARTGFCWCQRQKWAAQDLPPAAPGRHSPTKAPPAPGHPRPRSLPQRRETSASEGLALSHIRSDCHLRAAWTHVPLPGDDQAMEVFGL